MLEHFLMTVKISELLRPSRKGERSGFINYVIGYEHLDEY